MVTPPIAAPIDCMHRFCLQLVECYLLPFPMLARHALELPFGLHLKNHQLPLVFHSNTRFDKRQRNRELLLEEFQNHKLVVACHTWLAVALLEAGHKLVVACHTCLAVGRTSSEFAVVASWACSLARRHTVAAWLAAGVVKD